MKVEIVQTQAGLEIQLLEKLDTLMSLMGLGFGIAMVVVVVVAGARLGWRFWPWILLEGLIAWFLV